MLSYTRNLRRRQLYLVTKFGEELIHARCSLKVDLIPLTLDDSCANLGWSLIQLSLLEGVVNLFHADAAVRSVAGFKAGVQTLVSDALAVAIAGKLMDDPWYLGRKFVSVHLVRILIKLSDP